MNCFNKNAYKCVNCGSSTFRSDNKGLTCLYCSSYYLKDTLKEKESNNTVFRSSTALTVNQLRSAFASSERLEEKFCSRGGVRL